MSESAEEIAERIACAAIDNGLTIAAAESLTAGNVAAALGAASDAAQWFRGAIVAYSREVKYRLLQVPTRSVTNPPAARAMAESARALLLADIAVATTGAGGPQAEDGAPPGTVFIAIACPDETHIGRFHFDGNPSDIVEKSTVQALREILRFAAPRASVDTSVTEIRPSHQLPGG